LGDDIKRIIILFFIAFLIVVFHNSLDNYTDLQDYNLELDMNIIEFSPLNNSRNSRNFDTQNISINENKTDTIIKIISPEVQVHEIEEDGYVLVKDIYQKEYDIDSEDFILPGIEFKFQVLEINKRSGLKPVPNGKVKLTINSTYSVFTNYSIRYTDSQGYVVFNFNSPLTDTDWGYTLARTDPEELIIIAEFLGNDSYNSSETMSIHTTHWPPVIITDEHPELIYPNQFCFFGIIYIIIVSFLLFIVWQVDIKHYRIR
jgi:hypothetical protein